MIRINGQLIKKIEITGYVTSALMVPRVNVKQINISVCERNCHWVNSWAPLVASDI